MTSRSRLHLPGSLKNPRVRNAMWIALGVLALAAVVFAASALSGPRDAVPKLPSASTDLSAAEQSRRDYDAAQGALAKGDKQKAAGLLEKAVKEDPSNSAARAKLTELQSGGQVLDPANPPASKTETSPAGNGDQDQDNGSGAAWYDRPVSDLGKLLPSSVNGFRAGSKLVQGADAQLPLDPGSAENARFVRRILLSVHDRGSAAKATEFVSTQLRVLYPQARARVTAGASTAEFGSDGRLYGAVLFARGRFAYEVVMTASGPDPSKLKDMGDTVADSFPAKP
jgi:hypothetical protein